MTPRGNREEWRPSRRERAWDWRLRRVMRYGVGPGVMGWELIVDKAHDLFVFLVGAMLATSTDVLAIVRELIRQARLQDKTLEELLDEEGKEE